jgi:hypothetical protein
MSALGSAIGEARWLTRDRAVATAEVILGLMIAGAAGWIALSRNGVDPAGLPLGADFVSYWTAGRLALVDPAMAYDPAAHQAAQNALFASSRGYTPFLYPPTFLLLCAPLALAPYFCAAALWLSVTSAAYLATLRAYLGREFGWLPLLSFPALWFNLGNGQNGALTAALVAAGALALRENPVIAGVCFGAVAYKPHLFMMIPVVLIAAGRWRAAAAAVATAALLMVASLLAFGVEPWLAFIKSAPLARATLERGWLGYYEQQSVFAAVRLWGGGVTLAYVAQALAAVAAAFALTRLWRAEFHDQAEAPAIVCAALLVSPYFLDYDLTLIAIPLAWLARRACEKGFLPGERLTLASGFLLPLLARNAAEFLRLPLTPWIVGALFAFVVVRASLAADRANGAPLARRWACESAKV